MFIPQYFCRLWKYTWKKSYEHTYLLTPWCRVLLEKLTGLQLVKKFPTFHGTRRFITALTSVRHLSLSWASPIQSTYPHPTSWRSILILSTHLCLGLPSGLFPSGFPTKTLYTPSPPPYAPHAQPISFLSILSPVQYWVRSTNHLDPRYAISSILPLQYYEHTLPNIWTFPNFCMTIQFDLWDMSFSWWQLWTMSYVTTFQFTRKAYTWESCIWIFLSSPPANNEVLIILIFMYMLLECFETISSNQFLFFFLPITSPNFLLCT